MNYPIQCIFRNNRMNQILPFSVIAFILIFPGCKSKETQNKEAFFPILSYIKSQVAQIDTSLYQIIKLTGTDSAWDTTYIKREDVRAYAADFLQLPDLTSKELAAKYDESKFFDASLNKVIITYRPRPGNKDVEIQREEVMIEPDSETGDKVRNIVVDKIVTSADSSVTKRMLWNVGESFQVTTIIQKQNKEDSTSTIRIKWQ
jgi:hypothetical protein